LDLPLVFSNHDNLSLRGESKEEREVYVGSGKGGVGVAGSYKERLKFRYGW